MGLFDFLNPKKQQTPITIFARNLSINEKVAITAAMYLIVNQHGKRQIHPAEMKYIQAIGQNILDLDERDLTATQPEGFNFPEILKAMSNSDKRYFASVFYRLSTITQDRAVVGLTSVIVKDMGFSMEDIAKDS